MLDNLYDAAWLLCILEPLLTCATRLQKFSHDRNMYEFKD